jgi:hypothetical protein
MNLFYLCVYQCIFMFSVFRKVNKTSTEASLAPCIDQLYSRKFMFEEEYRKEEDNTSKL